MGETRYPLGGEDRVRFGYDDERYGCLCTFPFNYSKHEIGVKEVECFALLGAALCMYVNGGIENNNEYGDEYVLPDCVPKWVRDGIREACCDYPEEFETSDCIPVDSEYSYEDLYRKNLKSIKKWAKSEIKRLDNEKTEKEI